MLSLEKENWDSLTRLERCVKNGRYKHGDKNYVKIYKSY